MENLLVLIKDYRPPRIKSVEKGVKDDAQTQAKYLRRASSALENKKKSCFLLYFARFFVPLRRNNIIWYYD
jgi:hypothetical protein